MNPKHFLWFIIFISISPIINSQNITVNGILYDKEGGRISNGLIFIEPGNISAITKTDGEFIFNCSIGRKQISTKVLGYKPFIIDLFIKSDTIINIYLEVLPFKLNEVQITGEKVSNLRVTQYGNLVITPSAMMETPRLFSEADLLKSLQLLPGVVSGKDGSTDIYVRGGGAGQNIFYANGCSFFLPGHFLGMISSVDLDFLESAELFKDYFPADIGGGASSVIDLHFKELKSDSLRSQLRIGMLSSGFTSEFEIRKLKLKVTTGLKRGNYSIYAPVFKLLASDEVIQFLPSDKYTFYDGFFKLDHSSVSLGRISYLFFGNFDKGSTENSLMNYVSDTAVYNTDRITTGWMSMVHALRWEPPLKNKINWRIDLNYNKLKIERGIFHQKATAYEVASTSYEFFPSVEIIGGTLMATWHTNNLSWSAGINEKIKIFSPNIVSKNICYDQKIEHKFGENTLINESAVFLLSSYYFKQKIQLDAGLRISGALLEDYSFIIPEPRLRLSYNIKGSISPHLNYVRLSQYDHSVEGSNAGLRTMLWLPISKDFDPEISDVLSAGFQGKILNIFTWSVDGYYKYIKGMLDYKSGASFVYDTTFSDLLERIKVKAYGIEGAIIKSSGSVTGSLSYTWSRSKREFYNAGGLIWIPSNADRPNNINLSIKYHSKSGTSFGLNWIYQSGAPATIYEQETSYGEFFDTKNNIRYYDYHRMDFSLSQVIYKRKFSVLLDADIYNVYNRKNTFYFKKSFDWREKRYYFKNITLFPIMPSLTVTVKF